VVLAFSPSLSFGDIAVQKGSSITSNNPDIHYAYVTSKHETSAASGTLIYDGFIEYNPATELSCNSSTFTGEFTNITGPTFAYATVLERRFTNSGTVKGIHKGRIVASTVDYTIQSGPSAFVGITVRRADWEFAGLKGTTYTYFRGDPALGTTFFNGNVDGDVHGQIHIIGYDKKGHPITQTYVTSINGVQNTGISTTVWDNSTLYVEEPPVLHTDVVIAYGSSEMELNIPEGCLPAHDSIHSGDYFFMPYLNVGLYQDSWSHADGTSGISYTYDYHVTATTEVAPRLIGLTLAGAEDIIVSKGFLVGEVTSAYSSTIPKGRIISQSINAGELTDFSTYIDLVVSNGPQKHGRPK